MQLLTRTSGFTGKFSPVIRRGILNPVQFDDETFRNIHQRSCSIRVRVMGSHWQQSLSLETRRDGQCVTGKAEALQLPESWSASEHQPTCLKLHVAIR
mmetsp:Transcript_23903/g.37422  ORF Transcript_23903/g.37422 Transcript_23903/m.37422 type:complete len:98 (-) Transcript_23903:847-1140(-)